MKKLLSLILILAAVAFVATGCGKDSDGNRGNSQDQAKVSEIIKVAALNGPTGMAMAPMTDMAEKYNISTYQAPTDIVPKLISGEVDVAALPSNMAAVLYNKTKGQVVAVSPMVMGVLHILGNGAEIESLADLKGKTVLASGKGGTPEYVLQILLEKEGLTLGKDVEVEWMASHADVVGALLTTEKAIALLPEPFVSTALAKGGEATSDLFDLNTLWENATGQPLPMGVLVARKEFADNKKADLDVLLKDLQASVDFINEDSDEAAKLIVEKGFLGDEAVAKKAIPNCHLTLFAGEKASQGKEMLKTFNETLFGANPEAVGGTMPDEGLYYAG